MRDILELFVNLVHDGLGRPRRALRGADAHRLAGLRDVGKERVRAAVAAQDPLRIDDALDLCSQASRVRACGYAVSMSVQSASQPRRFVDHTYMEQREPLLVYECRRSRVRNPLRIVHRVIGRHPPHERGRHEVIGDGAQLAAAKRQRVHRDARIGLVCRSGCAHDGTSSRSASLRAKIKRVLDRAQRGKTSRRVSFALVGKRNSSTSKNAIQRQSCPCVASACS